MKCECKILWTMFLFLWTINVWKSLLLLGAASKSLLSHVNVIVKLLLWHRASNCTPGQVIWMYNNPLPFALSEESENHIDFHIIIEKFRTKSVNWSSDSEDYILSSSKSIQSSWSLIEDIELLCCWIVVEAWVKFLLYCVNVAPKQYASKALFLQ